jgi:ATP-dependent DNA helicase DinG
MNCDPSNTEKHTELIVKALPELVDTSAASLMLFSSRRQMQDVMQLLPAQWRDLILCQDDFQKSQLLKYHRQRIDSGEGSVIFGLSSFAEGVDLPGKYCSHVLIAKIPFAVPNDPIEMTLSEWIEQKGQNPFMTLAVPDAAFRLVQASGRLLRNENDSGKITLFDERIVNRRYGKAILDSMPPYKREIFEETIA